MVTDNQTTEKIASAVKGHSIQSKSSFSHFPMTFEKLICWTMAAICMHTQDHYNL